nr:hypothetical protein GCM10020241_59540 [Streptoalloteichus tenebrarius]
MRTLAADLGTRFTGALYLVASASFLGVGVPPDASDWAVMVDRNRPGLFVQPWAVLAPALLIVALSVGVNLLFDRALATRSGPGPRPGARPGARSGARTETGSGNRPGPRPEPQGAAP